MKEKKKKEIDRKKKDGQKEGKKQKTENNFRRTRQDMVWQWKIRQDDGRHPMSGPTALRLQCCH